MNIKTICTLLFTLYVTIPMAAMQPSAIAIHERCALCTHPIEKAEDLITSAELCDGASSIEPFQFHIRCALSHMIPYDRPTERNFRKLLSGTPHRLDDICTHLVARHASLTSSRDIIKLAATLAKIEMHNYCHDCVQAREQARAYYDVLEGTISLIPKGSRSTVDAGTILGSFDQSLDQSLEDLTSARQSCLQRLKKLLCPCFAWRTHAQPIVQSFQVIPHTQYASLCPYCKKGVCTWEAIALIRSYATSLSDYTDDEHTLIGDREQIWHIACVQEFIQRSSTIQFGSPEQYHYLSIWPTETESADTQVPHYIISVKNHEQRSKLSPTGYIHVTN